MGAWDELDTRISVENDTSPLDDLILDYSGDDIFQPLVEYAEKIKNGIEEGSKRGVQELAVRNRSFQQQLLGDTSEHPNAQGILATSITEEEETEYSWLIGTTITHFYPLCVEYGRGEVHPIPPNKRLRFYGKGGYLIYPLMSKEARPRPFVAPAFDKTVDLEENENLILREIVHAIG